MLTVEQLRFRYGSNPVLRDVSLALGEGELVFLLGANGAGKSTLFRCILGLLPDYEGTIEVNGQNTRRMTARELARQISYIPQSHHPTFSFSVLDMVLMGTGHSLPPFASPGAKERNIALQALEQLSIAHLAHRDFQELSGGQQQMVLIARGLAQQGSILLMDEPTASLDYGNQIRVLDQVVQLTRQGYTILLSCHNPQQALLYADRVIALHDGVISADGRPDAVLDPNLIQTLYQAEVSFLSTPAGTLIAPI